MYSPIQYRCLPRRAEAPKYHPSKVTFFNSGLFAKKRMQRPSSSSSKRKMLLQISSPERTPRELLGIPCASATTQRFQRPHQRLHHYVQQPSSPFLSVLPIRCKNKSTTYRRSDRVRRAQSDTISKRSGGSSVSSCSVVFPRKRGSLKALANRRA
jgi:ribosomal protein S27E